MAVASKHLVYPRQSIVHNHQTSNERLFASFLESGATIFQHDSVLFSLIVEIGTIRAATIIQGLR
jgi:hypothetical protein